MKILNTILGILVLVSVVRCGEEAVATATTPAKTPVVVTASPAKVIARKGSWCSKKDQEFSLGFGYANAELYALLKDAGIELQEPALHPITGELEKEESNIVSFCSQVTVKL